jgi:probable F420-dependent oxidoreductase
MNPLFCPPPNPFGPPKVMMAGVGPHMIEAAGEVADRFACHSFTSPDYLRDVITPALARGAAAAGRDPAAVEIAVTCYVATGNDAAEIDEAAEQMRRQVAFYGSTPAYSAVLDHHGYGALHEPLHAASRRGEWVEMGRAIDDDVLATYCVREPPERVAGEILRRYGDLADRVSFYYLGAARIDWKPIVAELQAAGSRIRR